MPSFYVARGSRPVVIVLVLAVEGCLMRANGGCQTPCLVISACAVAETALASTPPSSSAIRALPSGARPSGFAPVHVLSAKHAISKGKHDVSHTVGTVFSEEISMAR